MAASSAGAHGDEADDVFFDGDGDWNEIRDAFFDADDHFPSPQDPSTVASGDSSPAAPQPPPPPPPPPSLRRRRRSLSGSAAHSRTSPPPAASTASVVTSDQPVRPAFDASDEATSAAPSPAVETPPVPPFLETLVGFVIKAVLFQLNLFISVVTFPILVTRHAFLIVSDPLGVVNNARNFITSKVADYGKSALNKAGPFVSERFGAGLGVGGVAIRIVLGLLWAMYVCMILSALLVMAFLGAREISSVLVKQPLQVTESLRFDYTKPSPVAVVPIDWTVAPKETLRAAISLTLPESDYNRRLGVFQVRAEFISADGKVLSSSSQPCMLRFKSSHMHFVETFLRSISLLSGYSSESQVIKIKMKGFIEENEPVKFVKITLEQRAEFQPGVGIPQIYEASLNVKSELHLFRRIIWSWRRTIFVWITMVLFVLQLFTILLCCRPLVILRTRDVTGTL